MIESSSSYPQGRKPRTMVLCAGFGTRLRPLTNELPKPLLPFGDRTLLEHVVGALDPDLLPVVVNAHHLSELFVAFSARYPAIAHVMLEASMLGTAGGVAAARSVLGAAPVLVTNGDVLARVDARSLLARTPLDSVCLAVAAQTAGAGTVGLGAHGEVVRLRGERFGLEVASGDYVGTMALGPAALATLPEAGCLIGDVTLPLLRRGIRVPTLPVSGRWFAPGDSIADYLDEHGAWLRERAVALAASAGASPPSYVAPDARVEASVEVVSSVIGAGAVVTGSGRVTRVVAWPGARVVGPLADAVVTTAGQVVRRPSGA